MDNLINEIKYYGDLMFGYKGENFDPSKEKRYKDILICIKLCNGDEIKVCNNSEQSYLEGAYRGDYLSIQEDFIRITRFGEIFATIELIPISSIASVKLEIIEIDLNKVKTKKREISNYDN